jgi:hypothetical protein
MNIPPNLGNNALTYGLWGFGIAASIGVVKSFTDARKPAKPADDAKEMEDFPNIKHDSFVKEALTDLRTYQSHAPKEFRSVQTNLDKLIGLQISILQGKTEARFPYQAARHYGNIELAMKDMEFRLRNSVTPNFETDKGRIMELADGYRHNINADSNAFLMDYREGQ